MKVESAWRPDNEQSAERPEHGLYRQETDKGTEAGASFRRVNYVLAVLTLFQNGNMEVTLKARGRAISKAVDIAQILTKRFATDVRVKKVSLDTEKIEDKEMGTVSNVSSVEIQLER
jgi:DNA-binding protein